MRHGDGPPPSATEIREQRTWSRRQVLACGLGGVLATTVAGFELVQHGVLPGKQALDDLDGACSVSAPSQTFATAGPSQSGRFYSAARNRVVGYTVAYPPGHSAGSALALVISLHGFGGDHTSGLGRISLAHALAARVDAAALRPFALVSVDGGGLYWNAHPGDDPMAMIVSELIPMCQRLGLGRPPHPIGAIGISMGGYGALLLAEKHPRLITAIAAISPAVWTTYAQAHAANPGAFASASAFDHDNVITHAPALARLPVRVASGTGDPFHPGVVALAEALPRSATVAITHGCHDDAFFASQAHASLAFLGEHL